MRVDLIRYWSLVTTALLKLSLVWHGLVCMCCSGNWVNGVKSGHGAFVSGKDDSQLVGAWVNGSLTKGKWMFADGTTWHGSFKKNKPIGPGVFYFPNGTQQEVRLVVTWSPWRCTSAACREWGACGAVPTPPLTCWVVHCLCRCFLSSGCVRGGG